MDDKFIIVIEKVASLTDKDLQKINRLMKENGAVEIKEEIEPEDFKEESDEI